MEDNIVIGYRSQKVNMSIEGSSVNIKGSGNFMSTDQITNKKEARLKRKMLMQQRRAEVNGEKHGKNTGHVECIVGLSIITPLTRNSENEAHGSSLSYKYNYHDTRILDKGKLGTTSSEFFSSIRSSKMSKRSLENISDCIVKPSSTFSSSEKTIIDDSQSDCEAKKLRVSLDFNQKYDADTRQPLKNISSYILNTPYQAHLQIQAGSIQNPTLGFAIRPGKHIIKNRKLIQSQTFVDKNSASH